MSYLFVFIGGGLGSICRFLLSQKYPFTPGHIPWGTYSANIISCLILGFLVGHYNRDLFSDQLVWLLIVGFCGGFSTFSTFSNEIFHMISEGDMNLALLYMFSSVLLGMAGIWVGLKISQLF